MSQEYLKSEKPELVDDTITQNINDNNALIEEIQNVLDWAESRLDYALFGNWLAQWGDASGIASPSCVRWKIFEQRDMLLKLREVAYNINNLSKKI